MGYQASSVPCGHWGSVPLGTPGASVEHASEFSASHMWGDAEGLNGTASARPSDFACPLRGMRMHRLGPCKALLLTAPLAATVTTVTRAVTPPPASWSHHLPTCEMGRLNSILTRTALWEVERALYRWWAPCTWKTGGVSPQGGLSPLIVGQAAGATR